MEKRRKRRGTLTNGEWRKQKKRTREKQEMDGKRKRNKESNGKGWTERAVVGRKEKEAGKRRRRGGREVKDRKEVKDERWTEAILAL